MAEKHEVMIAENRATIRSLRDEHATFVERMGGAESEISVLNRATEDLRERQRALSDRHEKVIMPTLTAVQEQLQRMEQSAERMQQEFNVLADDSKGFQAASQKKFAELFQQASHAKEQVEFLMQATEMIKRRSRETAKSNTAKFQEGSEGQEKLAEQLAALERQLKRQEREVRTLENRSARADNAATLLPLPAPEPAAPANPTERLQGVLEQLERIAGSGPPHEQLGIEWNPKRPPLPFGGDAARRGTDADFARLQLPGVEVADTAPIDAARAGTMSSTNVRGMYGLSPRPGPQGPRTPRKKR